MMQPRRPMLGRLLRALALDDLWLAPGTDDLQLDTTDRRRLGDAVELGLQCVAVHFPDRFGQIAPKHLVDQRELGIHRRQAVLPGRPGPHAYRDQGEQQTEAQRGQYQTPAERTGLTRHDRGGVRLIGVHFSHLAAMAS